MRKLNIKKIKWIVKEVELMDFFDENKKEVLGLIDEISKTERETDKMVYKLYHISNEEQEIIEKT